MNGLFKCLMICCAFMIVHGRTGCIGENGEPVDMFILYKLPRLSDEADIPHLDEGEAYAYMDSNNPKFRIGSKAITDEDSPPGATLNQVYSLHTGKSYLRNSNASFAGPDTLAHIFYNDQKPGGHKSYSRSGHTKGALAFDSKSGFWLIHSVPRFPPKASEGYEYPTTGRMYGQSMICITFDSDKFDDIGGQLIYNHPHIHDSNLPTSFKTKYPNMQKLLKKARPKKKPFYRVIDLKSSGGVEYRHFAKYTDFHDDLYHKIVAKDLKTDLLTETWQHGVNIGPSCDGDFKVEDIDSLIIQFPSDSVSFSTMHDHSKFAIGKTSSMPYVCIGDINRQPSQFKRAGGTMCFKNFDIWDQYNNFVDSYLACD